MHRGDAMIFDAIATIVLCGMMLVPLINIVVGIIVGAWLGGPLGALVGLAFAVLIAAIEKWVADQLGWFEPETTTAEAAPLAVASRSSDLRPISRHTALSTPVYFTAPMPPLPPMMASARQSESEYGAPPPSELGRAIESAEFGAGRHRARPVWG